MLGGCRRLTDIGLRTVARRCVDLRRLDVSCCTLVTNTALLDVLSRCANLQRLDITGLYLSVIYMPFTCISHYCMLTSEHKQSFRRVDQQKPPIPENLTN